MNSSEPRQLLGRGRRARQVGVGDSMNGLGRWRHRALGVDQLLESRDFHPVCRESNRGQLHDPIASSTQPGGLKVEGNILRHHDISLRSAHVHRATRVFAAAVAHRAISGDVCFLQARNLEVGSQSSLTAESVIH